MLPSFCNTCTVCVAPRPEVTVHFERPSHSKIISNENSIAYVWIILASKQVFPAGDVFKTRGQTIKTNIKHAAVIRFLFISLIPVLFNSKLCDDKGKSRKEVIRPRKSCFIFWSFASCVIYFFSLRRTDWRVLFERIFVSIPTRSYHVHLEKKIHIFDSKPACSLLYLRRAPHIPEPTIEYRIIRMHRDYVY